MEHDGDFQRDDTGFVEIQPVAEELGQALAVKRAAAAAAFVELVHHAPGAPNGEPSRSQKTLAWSASTGAEPLPTVSLSFDMNSSASDCSACRKILVTASNFQAPSRCYVRDSANTGSTATGSPPPNGTYKWWSQGNETVWSGNWWGTHPTTAWLFVECDNGATSARHYGSPG